MKKKNQGVYYQSKSNVHHHFNNNESYFNAIFNRLALLCAKFDTKYGKSWKYLIIWSVTLHAVTITDRNLGLSAV